MVTAYVGATVIDGTGRTIPDATLVVDQGRITMLATAPDSSFEQGAEVHDLKGHTIIPGLIDCHVHVCMSGQSDPMSVLKTTATESAVKASVNAHRCLQAGFTSLRDAGADHLIDIGVKRSIDNGDIVGPRMQVSCECISITGGHGDPSTLWPPELAFPDRALVDSPYEARKAARRQLRSGADVLKVAASGGVLSEGTEPTAGGLCVDEMREVVNEARRVGKKTMAHAHAEVGIKNALVAGVDSIEHGTFLTDELIDLMVENDVFLVPTLVACHQIVAGGTDAGIPGQFVDKAKRIQEAHLNSFYKAYRAGVRIAMGTDAGTPLNYHGSNAVEMDLMGQAGMSVMDVIASASSVAAELLGVSDDVGVLQEGKIADMVVLRSDPLQDLSVLTRPDSIAMVVLGGQIVDGMVRE